LLSCYFIIARLRKNNIFYIYVLTSITGWWFTTLYLLCTPSIETWYTSRYVSIFWTCLYKYLSTIQFILWLYGWWNGSDTFVMVLIFLFIPPWRWPHKWPKHAGGYPAVKLHQNTLCICWYWYCICLINAWKTGHIKINLNQLYCTNYCFMCVIFSWLVLYPRC
jgi:hypothetical protein